MTPSPIRRALISVSDKTGVVELAHELQCTHGVEILSTGGTARILRRAGVEVTDVAAHTGADEIMDGRVKTLHPKIHGGILGRRGQDDQVMQTHDIAPIDLVVVNLYPFEKTIAQPDVDWEAAIENIDIGGPAMLRAAAKNHAHVTLLVDSADYSVVLKELSEYGGTTQETRRRLASHGFSHTATYDEVIAHYLTSTDAQASASTQPASLPAQFRPHFTKTMDLRYGENPHQQAALYSAPNAAETSLVNARVCQGKALSYNNLADADAALRCIKAFDQAPTCVIVKHANPCGVAMATDLSQAYMRAFATDPVSSFGGILAFNQPLDEDTARAILDNQFAEVILAPEVSEAALSICAGKKNLRVLTTGHWSQATSMPWQLKPIDGGLLLQEDDQQLLADDQPHSATSRAPDEAELHDLLFAWRVAKFVKSNAIVYARDGATIGIGAGQMSRVDSARIAGLKAADAELDLQGAVMASDAFFPFRDSIDTAAGAGIKAVIQPGGSIRDEEVIAAADEAGMAMLLTGMRHFRH